MPARTWMSEIYDTEPEFRTRPLSAITIPGTHDAGCYIRTTLPYLARTQNQNIRNQLLGGIRYFDLRPKAYGTNRDQFWTYHGPYYGDRLDGAAGILHEISVYMDNLLNDPNPQPRHELVILNISHFANFANEQHQAFIAEINLRLGQHLLPSNQTADGNGIDLCNTNYQDLLQGQSRVIILYDGAEDTAPEEYITNNLPLENGFFVISPKYMPPAHPVHLFDQYYGTGSISPANMRTNQLNKVKNRNQYNHQPNGPAWAANAIGGVPSTLHLFSWTLTPQPFATTPIYAAENWSNPLLEDCFTGNHWGMGNQRPYNPLLDPKINIIYVDAFESNTHYCRSMPACSRHGYATPVAIADYLNRYRNGPPNIWPGWSW